MDEAAIRTAVEFDGTIIERFEFADVLEIKAIGAADVVRERCDVELGDRDVGRDGEWNDESRGSRDFPGDQRSGCVRGFVAGAVELRHALDQRFRRAGEQQARRRDRIAVGGAAAGDERDVAA